MADMIDLGNNIYQIDVCEQGMPGRTSCYLIAAEKVALIETGAAPGAGHLTAALKDLDIAPEKVKYIIVTHIHLDHAGAAGVLVRELPEAKVLVHPRGARHLIDPSRLIAGARAVYGDRFERFFGEILPVPADRVHTPEDGETLDLGGGRVLTFYHTPGHARHHMVIHDQAVRGVYSGDALGVRFHALSKLVGFDFTLPSTPPSEFDPPAALETMDRIIRLSLENIYFTHFGKAAGAPAILARNRKLLEAYEDAGRRVYESGGGSKEIEKVLWEMVMQELKQYGVTDKEHPAVKFMELDIELNAGGIAYYLEKKSYPSKKGKH
ncbi:MAG: MBL fold metallo-hydrolase [Firmicutes bacterium]|nr:MBL fold metallo-hydrolase [Bacillota bacterium]